MHFPKTLAFTVAVIFLLVITAPFKTSAQEDEAYYDSAAVAAMYATLDSIDASILYRVGKVNLNDLVRLNVPPGYNFIGQEQARMIVEDLWGNPEDTSVLGMIVKEGYSVGDASQWAFILSYEETGYVKDEDADNIDYEEMMENIRAGEDEVNKQRKESGYSSVHVLGWAAKPYYDKERKIMHWAKKIKFGDEVMAEEDLTLNYDIRFLGRQGVLSMNAVGTMNQLADVNERIPDILHVAEFTEGNTYADFNPSVDKVAAYTVGGLIAGKLLAKAGILALLLKNIKLVILAIVGLGAAFRKKITALFSGKKEEEQYNYNTVATTAHAPVEDVQTADDIRENDETTPAKEEGSNT